MKLHKIAFILTIIGGLNWGLVALGTYMGRGSNWNVVNLLVGTWPQAETLVYLVVGLSALVLLFGHKKECRECNPSGMM